MSRIIVIENELVAFFFKKKTKIALSQLGRLIIILILNIKVSVSSFVYNFVLGIMRVKFAIQVWKFRVKKVEKSAR